MRVIRFLVGGLLLASVPAASFATDRELAGASLQLLAKQSMDDAQGTTNAIERSHFMLEFGRDRRVALRLDCNYGDGDYKATATSGGPSGSLILGSVRMTRAMCPPPHLDQRVARDLPYVPSYLLRDGKIYLSLMADGGIYEWAPLQVAAANADKDRVVKTVRFAPGQSSTVIRDRIVGRQYIDYQVRAGAGQRTTVNLTGTNLTNYFNFLPPDSVGVAMAVGQFIQNRFDGLLPDDGLFTVRVFPYRAAARRHEASDFTLSVSVTGRALRPVSAKIDAVLPGTRYHARTTVSCQPAYTKTRECEALVIRRGHDGTATVELRWDQNGNRRILFIKGEPQAAGLPLAMTFRRNARGWTVAFSGAEYFEIPEPLVYGG